MGTKNNSTALPLLYPEKIFKAIATKGKGLKAFATKQYLRETGEAVKLWYYVIASGDAVNQIRWLDKTNNPMNQVIR